VGTTSEITQVRVGLTDFVQQHGGDVAFAKVKPTGTSLKPGDELAELETMKVNVELPSPVVGTIVEVNNPLELKPELINQDPFGKGWLALIEPTNWEADRTKLLDLGDAVAGRAGAQVTSALQNQFGSRVVSLRAALTVRVSEA
jgi:glycine cleavage system H protein